MTYCLRERDRKFTDAVRRRLGGTVLATATTGDGHRKQRPVPATFVPEIM